jgi:hypothetical protein
MAHIAEAWSFSGDIERYERLLEQAKSGKFKRGDRPGRLDAKEVQEQIVRTQNILDQLRYAIGSSEFRYAPRPPR